VQADVRSTTTTRTGCHDGRGIPRARPRENGEKKVAATQQQEEALLVTLVPAEEEKVREIKCRFCLDVSVPDSSVLDCKPKAHSLLFYDSFR
jgi:hypothetical protein